MMASRAKGFTRVTSKTVLEQGQRILSILTRCGDRYTQPTSATHDSYSIGRVRDVGEQQGVVLVCDRSIGIETRASGIAMQEIGAVNERNQKLHGGDNRGGDEAPQLRFVSLADVGEPPRARGRCKLTANRVLPGQRVELMPSRPQFRRTRGMLLLWW